MNAKIVVAVVGIVTLVLGLGGLFRPGWVMSFVGYAVADNASTTLVHGEVRALYGGLLIVAAVFTLLSVPDPRQYRGRLLLLGSLWTGAGAGRLFGAFADGNPGLFGWLMLGIEFASGAALIVASQTAESTSAPATGQAPMSTG